METEKIAVYDDKHIGWKDDHKSLQQSNLIVSAALQGTHHVVHLI